MTGKEQGAATRWNGQYEKRKEREGNLKHGASLVDENEIQDDVVAQDAHLRLAVNGVREARELTHAIQLALVLVVAAKVTANGLDDETYLHLKTSNTTRQGGDNRKK